LILILRFIGVLTVVSSFNKTLVYVVGVGIQLCGSMAGKKRTSRKLPIQERIIIACFLILFLTTLGVVVYASVSGNPVENLNFWQGLLYSIITGVIGYLFGANRRR